ncbi:hypothetical protein SXCC_01696 [Gluconacetobacter sp. SXCC-1]|nr:hypothetical protein SXCC_01696 [Gluconacetobacter sp. SXCC-1]
MVTSTGAGNSGRDTRAISCSYHACPLLRKLGKPHAAPLYFR